MHDSKSSVEAQPKRKIQKTTDAGKKTQTVPSKSGAEKIRPIDNQQPKVEITGNIPLLPSPAASIFKTGYRIPKISEPESQPTSSQQQTQQTPSGGAVQTSATSPATQTQTAAAPQKEQHQHSSTTGGRQHGPAFSSFDNSRDNRHFEGPNSNSGNARGDGFGGGGGGRRMGFQTHPHHQGRGAHRGVGIRHIRPSDDQGRRFNSPTDSYAIYIVKLA